MRIYNLEYRRALLKILREDAADLIEMLGMRESIDELECPTQRTGALFCLRQADVRNPEYGWRRNPRWI